MQFALTVLELKNKPLVAVTWVTLAFPLVIVVLFKVRLPTAVAVLPSVSVVFPKVVELLAKNVLGNVAATLVMLARSKCIKLLWIKLGQFRAISLS